MQLLTEAAEFMRRDFRVIFRGGAKAANSVGELVMATLDRELHERIAALRPVQKQQVLDYVRGLEGGAPGLKPATALLRYAGSLPVEVVDEMERLIEEDCERIDPDGW